MGSVRWAFRCGSWTPSRSDWLFAARCIQREEKDRIGQFVFAKDAKSAMVSGAVLILSMLTCCTVLYVRVVCLVFSRQAGRLLLRRFVYERLGVPWSEIRLERSPRGKPYLAAPLKAHTVSFHVLTHISLLYCILLPLL